MHVATDIGSLHAALEGPRRQNRTIGLVPTMGALHAGHRALIAAARERCDVVVATVFVNPTQFGPAEDLAGYPRDAAGDRAKLQDWGCDISWAPTTEDVYPSGLDGVRIWPPADLLGGLCAPRRPGHFPGVLTVVAKLLFTIRPHAAFFGQKDYQQWRVIDQMAADLLTGVEIVRCPTVREPDGLAVSSRNAYLSPAERAQALVISRTLAVTLERYRAGERQTAAIRDAAFALWQQTTGDEPSPPELEYLDVVDGSTLQPVADLAGPGVGAIAARVGKARLIDNVILAEDSPDLPLLTMSRGTLFSRLV